MPPFEVSVKPGPAHPDPFLFPRCFGAGGLRGRRAAPQGWPPFKMKPRETSRFVAVRLRDTPSLGR